MKSILLTTFVVGLYFNVSAQRSLEFEVFTENFFYQNQLIDAKKKINSNSIGHFYLTDGDTWQFSHTNGRIQKSIENGFEDIANFDYAKSKGYSKEPVTYYFPVSAEEYYISTGKELILIKPDKSFMFLSSEISFRRMQDPEVNILQLTAASKNNNGEVFLAGTGIARKKLVGGVTAGLEYLPNGIFKISNGKKEHYDPAPGKIINAIVCANNGITWAATRDAILKFENGAWEVYNSDNSVFPDGHILDLFVDSKNRLWVATDKTAGEFSQKTFKKIDNLPKEGDFVYQDIHVDDNDIVWLGTQKYGLLMVWNDLTRLFHKDNSPITSNNIKGIYTTSDNKKVIITGVRSINEEGGLTESGGRGIVTLKMDESYFSKENKIFTPFNTNNLKYYELIKKHNNVVYALSSRSLYKNPENEPEEIALYAAEKAANNVHDFDFDSKGNVWMATSHYLKKFNGSNSEIFEADKKTAHYFMTKIAVDKNDNIWVVSKAGLSKFDGTNWTTYNKKNSELPGENINVLFCDSKNNLWVGANNWVAIINDGQFTVYDRKTSEIGKAGVYLIRETPNGDLWMKAGRGMARYSNGNFEFIKEFDNTNFQDFLIHDDFIIASNAHRIIRYNITTKEFKSFDDFLVSKNVKDIDELNGEIWVQSFQAASQRTLTMPNTQATPEAAAPSEEQLRVVNNDKGYEFKYVLIKYPMDKLLKRE